MPARIVTASSTSKPEGISAEPRSQAMAAEASITNPEDPNATNVLDSGQSGCEATLQRRVDSFRLTSPASFAF